MISLINQKSLASQIIVKSEISIEILKKETEDLLKKQPTMKLRQESLYLGKRINEMLDNELLF